MMWGTAFVLLLFGKWAVAPAPPNEPAHKSCIAEKAGGSFTTVGAFSPEALTQEVNVEI